jgi:hypothetical protein
VCVVVLRVVCSIANGCGLEPEEMADAWSILQDGAHVATLADTARTVCCRAIRKCRARPVADERARKRRLKDFAK